MLLNVLADEVVPVSIWVGLRHNIILVRTSLAHRIIVYISSYANAVESFTVDKQPNALLIAFKKIFEEYYYVYLTNLTLPSPPQTIIPLTYHRRIPSFNILGGTERVTFHIWTWYHDPNNIRWTFSFDSYITSELLKPFLILQHPSLLTFSFHHTVDFACFSPFPYNSFLLSYAVFRTSLFLRMKFTYEVTYEVHESLIPFQLQTFVFLVVVILCYVSLIFPLLTLTIS